jgi:hypothetical protein
VERLLKGDQVAEAGAVLYPDRDGTTRQFVRIRFGAVRPARLGDHLPSLAAAGTSQVQLVIGPIMARSMEAVGKSLEGLLSQRS